MLAGFESYAVIWIFFRQIYCRIDSTAIESFLSTGNSAFTSLTCSNFPHVYAGGGHLDFESLLDMSFLADSES
jgi:hypothetical protein